MDKKIAIVQSNYIPWKGYFDLINSVDEFILFDDMQYTRRDWRNRNKIKTSKGTEWLTIPVNVKGKYYQKINETTVASDDWAMEHWKTLTHNYSKSKYFLDIKDMFWQLYEIASQQHYLSKVNHLFITQICDFLGIKTQISWSSNYEIVDGKNERLISLCKQAGGTHYISGPSAKDYMDLNQFTQARLKVTFFDYSGYPEYDQRFPPFDHAVSILDLLFNEGDQASKFMKSF
ncbi:MULTISPECIES: WbqC family protein [unclassified Leptolyngbya]|uniref:WbqC family protein n=1 Tax=unclassified Leptolyngbya TaxID=2650499 RepID=UPI001685F703|nr:MULTISPECIES: WbqC family protein [unclassified Leptolyngbya]MBD1912378.1 WbqC family protein [Leptolyngbya sp. FACHB-8]MBD2157986.1 WbqC family protein [Leptolyngbya sp. FACHB-16]